MGNYFETRKTCIITIIYAFQTCKDLAINATACCNLSASAFANVAFLSIVIASVKAGRGVAPYPSHLPGAIAMFYQNTGKFPMSVSVRW